MTDAWLNEVADQERRSRERARRPVQQAAGLSLIQAQGVSPESAAAAARAASYLGLPAPAARADPTIVQQATAQRNADMLQSAPRAQAFMADPENAVVAHDQVESLSGIERLVDGIFGKGKWDANVDVARRFGGDMLTGLGSGMTGLASTARTYDRYNRNPLQPRYSLLSPVLDEVGLSFKAAGGDVAGTQPLYFPRNSGVNTGLAGDVVGGLGQISGQVLVAAGTGGTATLPLLYGQGVDQMDERVAADMARDGRTERTVQDDLAAQGGGVVTAITEKIGLDRILSAVPASVRGNFMRRLTDIAVAGFTEGTTEALEAVGQNALAINLLGEDARGGLGYLDGAAEQAAPAGLVGSIARLAVMAAVPGVQHVQTQAAAADARVQHIDFTKTVEAVTSNPLLERAPERLRQYLASATDNGNVYVSGQAVSEFFQSHPDLDAWMDEWDIRDQVQQAAIAGTDVEIPAAVYLTQIAPTEAHAAFSQDLRLGPDAMTLREAEDFEAKGEESLTTAVDSAVQNGVQQQADDAPVDRVRSDIFDQLRGAGVSVEVARQNAILVAERAKTRAARSPQLYADAWEAYAADGGLKVQAEVPASVQRERDRLDVVIEVMRNRGAQPTQRAMRGQTLLEFLSDNGGVTDVGGDLKAMGLDAFNRPSQGGRRGARPVIRPEGAEGSAFGADYAVTRAIEAGYLPEGATTDALYEAMQNEMSGRPTYSADYARDAAAETTIEAAADLEALLPTLGLDAKATNEEIRKAVARMGDAAATGLDQSKGSSVPPIDRDLAATILSDRRAARGVKIGAKADLWRGVGENTGSGMAVYGLGTYITADKRVATDYAGESGEVVEIGKWDLPDNPLRFARKDDYQLWRQGAFKALGYASNLDFVADYPDVGLFVKALDPSIDGIQVGTGKDAFWVRFPGDELSFNQDDDAVGPKRGRIQFTDAGATITLFRAKDRSTFLHEISHKWLDELVIDATAPNASPEVAADLEKVLAWFSENAGKPITVDDIGVDQHELFARGGEVFFMEGKAPSVELRPAFRRFTDWLKGVYRNVLALNAPVSQPVREVMGRLIATDDEIAAAVEAQKLSSLFYSADAAGMTKAEYAAWTRMESEAKAQAETTAMRRVMEPLRRKLTLEYKNRREELRERQTEIVDAMPDIAAIRTLSETGEHINRQALIDLYGSDRVLKLLPRGKTALYADDGVVHPDALAEAVGASSGETLINALMGNQAERQARQATGDKRSVRDARIEDRMDEEMTFLEGDPLTDGTIDDIAMQAVHSRLQMDVMARDVTRLSQLGGEPALWTREGIEAYARDTIQNVRASKLRPATYLRAERSAGIKAQRALLAKKYLEARDARLLQSVNFALYRAAVDAQEAIEKGEALFARVISAKDKTTAKSRNFDMVNAARSILAGYGLARKGGEPVANYMSALKAYDPDAWAALDETVNDALAVAKPVDDLSVSEFGDLYTTIEQLWNLSRDTQNVIINGIREEAAAVRTQLTDELTQRGPPPVRGGGDGAVTAKERIGRRLLSGRHLLGRVEEWAIRKGPAFTKYVARPVFHAGDAYRTMERTHMPTLEAAFDTLRPDVTRVLKIAAPEIGYTFGNDGGNGIIEVIGALRHVGNPSNYRKLLLGRKWGTQNEDGSLNDTAFRGLLDRLHRDGVLLKRHWDFVQSEWDLHDEIKPEVQRAHRRMTGRYFEEVTAAPVTTPFGTYKGGYVPAKVDAEIDSRASELDVVSILANGANGSLSFPYAANGFTKARVEHNKPLNLDVRQAMSQFGEAMRYATLGPAVLDVSRILRERTFADTLDAYDRDVWNEMLLPWLTRSVAQRTSQPSASAFGRAVENTVGRVVSRTGTALMFANVLNASQQVTGALPATLRTGNRNMAFALRTYLANPAAVTASVVDMSPMMANRMGTQMRDLSDTANQIVLAKHGVGGAYQSVVDWSEKHKYWMQKGVQNVMDPIVWTAAYNKGVQMKEADPVAYADSVIRTTQDSYSPENAPGYLSGPKWAQAFTQFSGWFNTQANLQVSEAAIAVRDRGMVGASPRLLQIAAMGTLVPAIASELVAQALRGTLGDEDDDGWWDDLADVFLFSSLRYALAYLPFVGQVGNAVINRFDDKPYNDKMSIAPVFTTVEAPISLAVDVTKTAQGKGDASRTVKDFGTTFTTITGIPLLNRQAGYVADVVEGDVEPLDPLDAARGFVSGQASEDSRTDR